TACERSLVKVQSLGTAPVDDPAGLCVNGCGYTRRTPDIHPREWVEAMPATADEKDAIHKLEVRIAEISTSLSFIKWIGVFLAGCAVTGLTFLYNSGQRVTRIEDAVVALQRDSAKLKTDFKARDRHISESLYR